MIDSLLWLPESAKEALSVDSVEAEDDVEAMIFINQSVVNWLGGELDTGTMTDIFLQYNIDPHRINRVENLIA